jgi:hypothetical protein
MAAEVISTSTAMSSSIATTPAARLAYQNAVVPVISRTAGGGLSAARARDRGGTRAEAA